VITMSDGSTVTVGSVDGSGNILTFIVTTSGGTTITTGVALTQTSVLPANGQTGFTLTPEIGNVTGSTGGNVILIPGAGAGSGSAGEVQLAGVLNTNDFDITGPTKDSATPHPIDIIAGITNNDETIGNEINITGGEVDYLAGGGTVVAGDVNITGGVLTNKNDNATGGSVNIVGAGLPNQTAGGLPHFGYAGGVTITGGTVPDGTRAEGGPIVITGGDAYAGVGTSVGGRVTLKGGEAYDFPGDIFLEPGGSEGNFEHGAVVLQASVYGGALGNYGGDETTAILQFQGLQSGTTLGSSGRINNNYVALRAPNNIPVEYVLTLPSAQPTVGQVLSASAPVSNQSTLSWVSPSGAPEGTAVLSTGEVGGTKFLREDGDGTSSWQIAPGGGSVSNPMTADLDVGGYDVRAATGALGAPINIIAGSSTGGGNYGGQASVIGGDSTLYSGGSVLLKGGETSAAYAGGTVTMYGGDATGSAGIGGAINLLAGDGGNSGNGGGGNIRIAPGNGGGSTGAGAIVINHNIAHPVTTGDKLYNAVIRSTAERTLHWDGLDLTSALRGLNALNNTPSFNFGTDINLNGGDGYLGAGPTAGIGGDIVLTAGLSRAPSPGTQEVNIGGAGGFPSGAGASGLANNATVYTAAIVVDGGSSQPIAITGSTAQTHATLIDELNADTTGAVWSITAGSDLIATSDSTGVASSIAITDTDLFLTVNNFVSVDAATAGIAPTTGAIVIPDQTAPSPTTNKLYAVAGALTWNGTDLTAGDGLSKFAQDNTTTVAAEVFNHALGTTDVTVQVFDLTVTPKELMIPSTVAITDANNVTITLAIAPSSSGDYRVVITG